MAQSVSFPKLAGSAGKLFYMKIFPLVAVILFGFGASIAEARNLSSVDGNTLLTKCHAAEQMAEVSPKLSPEEWSGRVAHITPTTNSGAGAPYLDFEMWAFAQRANPIL